MATGKLSTISSAILALAQDVGNRATKTALTSLATRVQVIEDSGLDSGLTEDEVNELIKTQIAALIDGAPETLDTLKEIADAIEANGTVIDALNEAVRKRYTKDETDLLLKNKADASDLVVEDETWTQIELLSSQYAKDGGK